MGIRLVKEERESIEDMITNTNDNDFTNCPGYMLNGHQLTNLMENNQKEHKELRASIERLELESNANDKKILDAVENLNEAISENKKSGDDRAVSTEGRLSSLETATKGMSDYMKWLLRTVVFGVFIFIVNQVGIIDWIKTTVTGWFG